MADTPASVRVPIVSAWYSKINWAQVAPVVATGLTWLGVKEVSTEQILTVFTGVSAAVQIATVVFRTFFNGSVSPSSLPPGSTA